MLCIQCIVEIYLPTRVYDIETVDVGVNARLCLFKVVFSISRVALTLYLELFFKKTIFRSSNHRAVYKFTM